MSPETTAARRVGALVLAALAVLALAVLLIGDRQNLFQPKNRYYVRFVSVAGLRQGSDVQLNGVNVGSVERIVLPADTPQAIVERLNQEIETIAKSQQTATQFSRNGITVEYTSPEAFAQIIRDDRRRWGEVAKASGAQIE